MSEQQSKAMDEEDNELLTAYLDGELSDSECIVVEKRLAEEPAFHNRMLELQATWDMLDSLPMVKPDSQFVRTTVEMAITGHRRNNSLASGLFKGLLLLLIPATVFGASYFFKRESIERPERELFHDLPLIENQDRYTKALVNDDAQGGIEFLRSMYKQGLLREVGDLLALDDARDSSLEDPELWESQPPSPQQLKDRSDRVSRMTPEEQAELFEKKKKFESLTDSQRETIREFHGLLVKDPDRNKLAQTLSSYFYWLKNLGKTQPSQQANLLDLPLDKRLVEIGRIARQQAEQAFGETGSSKLPDNDAVSFYQWYDFSIGHYHLEIRERAGDVFSALQQLYKGMPVAEEVLKRIKTGPIEQLVEFLMRNDREFLGRLLCKESPNGDVGIGLLRKFVSSEAISIVDQPGFRRRDKEELILKWIEAANRAGFAIKTDVLKAFYAKLTQEQRDELDNQHPDDRDETLTRMYWEAHIGKRSTASAEEDFEDFLRQNGLYTEFEFWDAEQ